MTLLSRVAAVIAAAALLTALPLAPAQAKSSVKHLTFTVIVTSTGTTLQELPGDVTYGWNHLVGPTKWGKRSAELDFLGSVDYIEGSGGFGGFITVTRSDGTKLAFRADGNAMSPPVAGTEDTHFAGSLEVIGGSGKYKGATGIGTMTGVRKAALGSPVKLTFDLRVRQ